MKATVDMHEWEWGRLATIAEQRNTTIGALVAEGIRIILDRDKGRLRQLDSELKAAYATGHRAPRRSSRG